LRAFGTPAADAVAALELEDPLQEGAEPHPGVLDRERFLPYGREGVDALGEDLAGGGAAQIVYMFVRVTEETDTEEWE